MHPVVIIIPTVALVFGPQLWVRRVLKRYNQEDLADTDTSAGVARSLLDENDLKSVKVECTDLGDHYDPDARSVRISRDKFDRRSLTAVTTAAHEVGHAIQHATGFAPFVWRIHLTKVARAAGEIGSVMLLSVPVAALTSRDPVPAYVIGLAALGILGTGMAVQLVTLPTEVDASFNKALKMLENGHVGSEQLPGARKILVACSLTYVASSLASVLNVWPWLPRRTVSVSGALPVPLVQGAQSTYIPGKPVRSTPTARRARKRSRGAAALVRRIGKPVYRGWLRWSRAL